MPNRPNLTMTPSLATLPVYRRWRRRAMRGREPRSEHGEDAMGRDEETPPEDPEELPPADGPSTEPPRSESGSSRFARMARRLMDRKELAEDTRDVIMAVLSTSDRAKTEAVKMVAREVRTYLEELKLKDEILELLTSHSLEVSLHLKPLPPREPGAVEKKPRSED